tara:strand:+ start:563 stop:715 length:153 start_codon:yes stop_codon:yes gene_type:complete
MELVPFDIILNQTKMKKINQTKMKKIREVVIGILIIIGAAAVMWSVRNNN